MQDDPNLQFRRGVKVATSIDWLKSKMNKKHNLAFIQLDKPFVDVKPFEFLDTQLQGYGRLGVVGYPGDKIKEETGEKGAEMYEMYMEVTWDRNVSDLNMLEHRIPTYAGKSPFPLYLIAEYRSRTECNRF